MGLVAGLLSREAAAEEFCDKGLTRAKNTAYAYDNRDDDRCEGFFTQPVAGESLVLASLVSSISLASDAAAGALALTWGAAQTESVTVQAVSLRKPKYYRMDTRRPGNVSSFSWNTQMLRNAGVQVRIESAMNLGFVARTQAQCSFGACEVYLPLQVSSDNVPWRNPADYSVTFMPLKEANHLSPKIMHRRADGKLSDPIENAAEVKGGRKKLAGIPFEVRILATKLPEPGIYEVELTSQDGSATAYFRFWHLPQAVSP